MEHWVAAAAEPGIQWRRSRVLAPTDARAGHFLPRAASTQGGFTVSKLLLLASVAALAVPALASAQTTCHHEKDTDRVVGTVIGAGVGAVVGSAIAGPHHATAGAIVGGVGGGLAGNAVGGSAVHCDRYDNGYYDSDGGWHAAGGYYAADGRWIATAPGAGYYDNDGRWVPTAPPARYYGADVAYAGSSLEAREERTERRIRSAEDAGALSEYDADRAYRSLNAIRDSQASLSDDHDGLTAAD